MIPTHSSRSSRCPAGLLFLASLGAILLLPLVLALITGLFYIVTLPVRLLMWGIRWGWSRRVLLACAVVILIGGVVAYVLNQPACPARSETIVIEHGMSTGDIARFLEQQGFIRSASFFKLLTRWIGADGRLRAGEYLLSGDQSTRSILRTLVEGRTALRRVTLPEGLTAREIAGILSRETLVDSVKIAAWVEDSTFCRSVGIAAPSLEGYLYPDTYHVPRDIPTRRMMELMIARFHAVFDDSLAQRARQIGFTVHEILTLASIIEREARVEEERPIISGIFHRRLKLGRRLEADPTVEYALGMRKKRLLYKDLEVDSPYNTYRYAGLPPGPICNPGRASILAALYPADTPYLYFVARGDGTHVFTSSKRDHLRAKRRIRQSLKK